jgi:hypothetical protein
MTLFTVTDGPTLNLWGDTGCIWSKRLTIHESLYLVERISDRLRAAQRDQRPEGQDHHGCET